MSLRSGTSVKESAGNLKYGDVVLLYYTVDKKFQAAASGNQNGFILADLSGSCSQQVLKIQPGEIMDQELPNIQYGTFQVIASNKHDAQNRHTTLEGKLEDMRKRNASPGSIKSHECLVAQVKRDVQVEKTENSARQKRMLGENVKYGDKIQLQHILSGKYVCASVTDTSITDNSKLRVFLQDKDSIGCILRIQPRVKVKTGEEVSYADLTKFESMATLGQYLHSSKRTFGKAHIYTFSECFELNLSAKDKDSSLKIICYYQPVKRENNSLKARSIVRFVHRKYQCYVVGEGSFVGRCGDLPTPVDGDDEDLGMKRSRSLFSLTSAPNVLQVAVDLEPSEHEAATSSSSTKPSDQRLPDDSISLPKYQKAVSGDEVVCEDVHFEKRRKTHGKNSDQSSSPFAFWQVEKVKLPYSGGPMEWSEECRIKHLSTGQYLAVTSPDYKVTLKSCTASFASTIFELHSDVHEARGEVTFESTVRVKNKSTGTWLHLDKDMKYNRSGSQSANSIFSAEESTKELYQVTATKEINSEDIFTLEKVVDEDVKDFNTVASITAVLANQIQQCELLGEKPHSPSDCGMEAVLSSLSSLGYLGMLLSKKSGENELKKLRKMLRCMKTLVLVVRLMNLHQNERGQDPTVCRACFGIIHHFLKGKSSKNKAYIAEMMSQIFTISLKDMELTGDISIENALIGIAKENPKVLFQSGTVTRIIRYVTQTLRTLSKSEPNAPKLLEILVAVCSCKGVPVEINQLIILDELQRIYDQGDDRKHCQLFYSVRRRPQYGMGKKRSRKSWRKSEQLSVEMDAHNLTKRSRRNCWSKSQFAKIASSGYANIVQYYEVIEPDGSGDEGWRDLNKGSKVFHKFFVAQISLLVAMCKGNVKIIETLQSDSKVFGVKIDFELVMSAIIDQKLRASYPALVSALIELLKVMYVDVGENRPFLEKLPFAFKFNELSKVPFESTITGDDHCVAAATALTGVVNEHFSTIRDWIKWFLQNKSEYSFAAGEEEQNGVVVKVLQVLTALVKYGYYDDSGDIKDLLPAIHELLDGQDDYPTRTIRLHYEGSRSLRHLQQPLQEHGAHQVEHGHEMRILGREMTTLASFADSALPDASPEEIKNMKKDLEKYRSSGRFESMVGLEKHFQVKHWAIEVLNLLFNFELYKSLHRFIYDFRSLHQQQQQSEFHQESEDDLPRKMRKELSRLIVASPKMSKKITTAAQRRLRYITEECDDVDLSNRLQLPDALIDLASYNYEHLIQRSLMLLDRYYTSKSDIFAKAIPAQLLITSESVDFFKAIEERLFLELLSFLKPGSGSEDTEATRSSSVVRELTEYCWLMDEVEGYEPHHINRNIILSFGVLPDVVHYIVQYCNGPLQVEGSQKKKLMECFSFLRALACKNTAVQTKLLEHLDVFIKGASGVLGFQIGELLREVFSGGPSISLSVKEDQMHRIMQTMFANGKEDYTSKNSALVGALNELLLVKDLNLPLKHNQLVVANFISQIREDDCYWCKELLAAENNERRKEILKMKDDSDPRLINLLMIADLLATCAIGDNEIIDSICCTIYGEEELIDIISSKDISIYRKRPFMKLLVWVHMTVQGSGAKEKASFYRNNKKLWDHMSKMAAVLHHTSEVMTSQLPPSSYLAIKELLASPTWRYSHHCDQRMHTADVPQTVITGSDIGRECFEIADVLLYYTEAFLPFLKTYYTEVYQRDRCILEGNTTNSIYTALLSFYKPLIDSKRVYFTQELQVKLYYRVLFLIEPNADCDLNPKLMVAKEAIIENTKTVFEQEVVSQAREDYCNLYEDEIKLNKDFNKFVLNYKAAYEGSNTTKEQVIGTTIAKKNLAKKEYSEFLDDAMMKPGPRFLPLGRSFQEHVAKFVPSGSLKRNPKETLLKQLEISFSKGGASAGNSDSERQTELDIKCLQLLRAVIYNKTILIDEEVKERNPKQYREDCKRHVHPVQSEIQDLGNTVLRVMPLLSHPNERIVHEVLAFLDAILGFGNTHVQEGLKELANSRNHLVFSTLRTILKRASTAFNESELLFSLIKARSDLDQIVLMRVETSRQEAPTMILSSLRKSSSHSTEALPQPSSQERKSSFATLLRLKRATKIVQLGEESRSRVQFLSLYQHTVNTDIIDGKSPSNFRFYDLSHITLISKVLGLMCDGQYKVMQDFLREQTDDSHNVNMVGEMSTFLYDFSNNRLFNKETLELFNQLVQALKEFCVGNNDNRRDIFDANVMSVINYVLQIDITNIRVHKTGEAGDCSLNSELCAELQKMALQLKASAVELLDVLLEEITSKPSNLSQQIAEGLDIPALNWSMLDFYTLKDDPDLRRMKFDDNAYRALFVCHRIIMHMADNKLAPMDTPRPSGVKEAWDYCEKRSRSIEIVYKIEESDDESLTRIHFIMDGEYEINDQLKDKVKLAVDRSTHASKLRDFHEWMDAVKKDTLHRAVLDQNLFTRFIKTFSRARYWLLLLVILALNILLFLSDNDTICPISISYQNGTLSEDFKIKYVALTFLLGGLFAFLAVWMLLEYFIVTWPHFVLPVFFYDKLYKLLCPEGSRTSWIGRLLPKFNRTKCSVNIFGIETIYLVLFVPIAASPLYCFGYLYCAALFYIIVTNDILQRALQSITRHWKSLIWVAILLLVLLYCYAVISFTFLREEFNEGNSNVFCSRLDECLISILRFGLHGDFLEIGVQDANDARARFFYDVTFFIIITTIGLNIVFGIIVDTFSELRDEKFTAEQDLKSTCFICNLESYKFDKRSNNGFDDHVKKDHNMWDYIYYSIYLDQIDVTDHNATQKYLYDKISKKSIDYIPFHKAIALKGKGAEDDELKEELEELEQSVKENFSSMNQRFDVLRGELQQLEDTVNQRFDTLLELLRDRNAPEAS